MLPTLDEFIARGPDQWPRNSYVREPGFSTLYVRWGRHALDGEVLICLDLANMTARHEGKGTFKRLVARLREQHPSVPLFVESVLNEQLIPGLLRLGFETVPDAMPPSFLLGRKRT